MSGFVVFFSSAIGFAFFLSSDTFGYFLSILLSSVSLEVFLDSSGVVDFFSAGLAFSTVAFLPPSVFWSFCSSLDWVKSV